jgi:hypothetical protein
MVLSNIRYKDSVKKMHKGEEIVVETWYDGVRFCPVCDPERAHIQNTSTSSEELGQRLETLPLQISRKLR